MDSPRRVIKFMNENLYSFEDKYKDIDRNVLKTAIAYKYLLAVYLNSTDITIDQILVLNDFNIGLIGLGGDSCLVSCLEFVFGNRICHLHLLLHDSYGRIYTKYDNIGRGYNYMFNAPNWMRKCPCFGHITGILYSIYYTIRYYREYQN